MDDVERILSNNETAEALLGSLRKQIAAIKIQQKVEELEKENSILRKQVELAKEEAIKRELIKCKKQYPISQNINKNTVKPLKPNVKRKNENQPADSDSDEEIDVSQFDFRVGKIVEVSRHPDVNSLYFGKIDCGETNLRSVVSGLGKFVPIEEMQNRLVIVLCNLKPTIICGIDSQAMVMCSSSEDQVNFLYPPTGAVPGDLVYCDGFPRNPERNLNPKQKIFKICSDLSTNNDNKVACFKGKPLTIPGKGVIISETLESIKME